ncbi:EF-hand domain-containing protein [Marinimicrobium locisalis]|uniref:EF-hand domain-containing protein n=1 Tax=Marinimicrobium locisalis TaxID=546022 RepID=UPI00322169CA
MNMKTIYALTATALFSLGSLSAVAQDWGDDSETDTETGTETESTYESGTNDSSAFSVIDQNGDGSIDKDEARNAGVSDSRFESMDANGDGTVSQSEYEG